MNINKLLQELTDYSTLKWKGEDEKNFIMILHKDGEYMVEIKIKKSAMITYKAPNHRGTGNPTIHRGESGESDLKSIDVYSLTGVMSCLADGTIRPKYCILREGDYEINTKYEVEKSSVCLP